MVDCLGCCGAGRRGWGLRVGGDGLEMIDSVLDDWFLNEKAESEFK